MKTSKKVEAVVVATTVAGMVAVWPNIHTFITDRMALETGIAHAGAALLLANILLGGALHREGMKPPKNPNGIVLGSILLWGTITLITACNTIIATTAGGHNPVEAFNAVLLVLAGVYREAMPRLENPPAATAE